jgi:toxin YhaV
MGPQLTRTRLSKEASQSNGLLVINGWQIFSHPLLIDQLEKLLTAVETARRKDMKTYKQSADYKLLAVISKLMFEEIPEDPTREKYRQGDTLGKSNKQWFRAKFGAGRFRLFFRYSSTNKVIIFVWINDDTSLRTYGARNDAYAVFAKMIKRGNPPDDWKTLHDQCKTESSGLFAGLFRGFGKR